MDFSLWLPIVVATVACFIGSALIWMVGKYHAAEWSEAPNMAGLRDLLRAAGVKPGAYMFPYMTDADRKDKARAAAKMKEWAEGPSGLLFVVPPGGMNMGKMMGQQFVFFLLVNVCIAVIASHSALFGATRQHVAAMTGMIAFMANLFASIPESIWFGRPWKSLMLQGVDAVIYAAATAAAWSLLYPYGLAR
jgi:hypothetical protein